MKSRTKKRVMTVSAIGLSAALLAGSALAASNSLSAYTTFKESVLQTMSASSLQTVDSNYTVSAKIVMTRNGETVMQIENVSQQEGIMNSYGTSKVTAGGTTTQNETWIQRSSDGKVQNATKDANGKIDVVYFQGPSNADLTEDSKPTTAAAPSNAEVNFVNALIDTLMGDMKNYFTYDGDYIVANLTGSQIPDLIQLGFAAMISSKKEDLSRATSSQEKTIAEQQVNEILALQNLRIDSINGRMKPEGKAIDLSTGTMEFTFSGVDSNGIRVSYAVSMDLSMTEIGTTKADRIDLTGKEYEMTDHTVVDVDKDAETKHVNADGSVTASTEAKTNSNNVSQ